MSKLRALSFLFVAVECKVSQKLFLTPTTQRLILAQLKGGESCFEKDESEKHGHLQSGACA